MLSRPSRSERKLLGRTIHSRFVDSNDFERKLKGGNKEKVAWGELPNDVRKALEIELSLLSIIMNTQALPVWLRVMTLNESELSTLQTKSADASDEWINESLMFAQFELDEYELWIREAAREQLNLETPGKPLDRLESHSLVLARSPMSHQQASRPNSSCLAWRRMTPNVPERFIQIDFQSEQQDASQESLV